MFAVNQLFINNLLVVILSTAQIRSETIEENLCQSKSKCNECIETPSCAWYFEPEESFQKKNHPRCYKPDTASQDENYSAVYQFMPTNQLRMLSNQPLNSSYDNMDRILFSPQKVEMKLRTGNSYGFGFQYEQVEDYPVDLYLLMDLSTTMRDEREKLTVLGNQLLSTLRNLTSNLRVGIGSYVHGIVTPNASKLNSPCTNCATSSYGFRNEMRLSKNFSSFSLYYINVAPFSRNLNCSHSNVLDSVYFLSKNYLRLINIYEYEQEDFLEHTTVSNELNPAGYELDLFNSITQAVVCKDQIGWRNNARRILVVATNDGVPKTITNFNDYNCHIGNDGTYDWTISAPPENPNISKLNVNVREIAINIIFAVTGDQIDAYGQLSNQLEGSSIGTLSSDSSNIKALIKQEYEQISSTIVIKDNATHEINYFSKCLNPDSDELETNTCSGFKTGQIVDFRLEMNIRDCPSDRKNWKETIQVYGVGLRQSLIIDLEVYCSCPEEFY